MHYQYYPHIKKPYYPFGSAIQSRSYASGAYRYGFNGKEIDKGEEGMGGGGSTYDYGFRIYNAQLGKFLSVDPLSPSYPWYTPFQFAGNMPIVAVDLDGLEEALYLEVQTFGVTWLSYFTYIHTQYRIEDVAGTYLHATCDGWKPWSANYQNSITRTNKKEDIKKIEDAAVPIQENLKTVIDGTPANTAEYTYLPARVAAFGANKATVKFDVNVSTTENAVKNMSSEAKQQLQTFAVQLLNISGIGLEIQGYADAQGGDTKIGQENNQLLSENRAEAAKVYILQFLRENGTSEEKIVEIGKQIKTNGNGQVNDGTTDNSENRKVVVSLTNANGDTLTQPQADVILEPYVKR